MDEAQTLPIAKMIVGLANGDVLRFERHGEVYVWKGTVIDKTKQDPKIPDMEMATVQVQLGRPLVMVDAKNPGGVGIGAPVTLIQEEGTWPIDSTKLKGGPA